MNETVVPFKIFQERMKRRDEKRAMADSAAAFVSNIHTFGYSEEEEMDILAAAMEELTRPKINKPRGDHVRFSVSRIVWETNPLSEIFRITAEEAGISYEETFTGNTVEVTVNSVLASLRHIHD